VTNGLKILAKSLCTLKSSRKYEILEISWNFHWVPYNLSEKTNSKVYLLFGREGQCHSIANSCCHLHLVLCWKLDLFVLFCNVLLFIREITLGLICRNFVSLQIFVKVIVEIQDQPVGRYYITRCLQLILKKKEKFIIVQLKNLLYSIYMYELDMA
jgi:hypothetical protein